jgi:hypothetical protein
VARSRKFAVTAGSAMTLSCKSVVDTEMVTYAILIRRAVAFIAVVKLAGSAVMASAVRRAKAAVTVSAVHAGLRRGYPLKLRSATVIMLPDAQVGTE